MSPRKAIPGSGSLLGATNSPGRHPEASATPSGSQRRLPEITEKNFQQSVIDLARLHGCLVYHTYDSRRSEKGWPDLVIVGPRGVLFRELKADRGRVKPEQWEWIEALKLAGQDAGVWRPVDWPEVVLAEIQLVGRRSASRAAAMTCEAPQ